MKSLRTIAVAAAATAFGLVASAQTPADHVAHHADSTAPAVADVKTVGRPMAQMDEHMKAMHEMHEEMKRARTPEEKSALMAKHMKLMQDGMTMMGGMGPGAMGGMKDQMPMSGDMSMHNQMMERRMEMMQAMMQMMMDRMPQPAAKP